MSNLTLRQGFAPQTMGEAIQFSEMLAKSQMVPRQYQGKPEDIMVAVQWGYEIGLAPLQALQNISVINGKPSVYGDAAMALVQSSPVCEDIEEFFEDEGTPNPVAVCVAKRKGRKPVTSKFSVEDAKRAGLWGKQGPWTQYPKRMMQMRARGFALRDGFPDVLKGLITAEEAMDFPVEAIAAPRDITPADVAPATEVLDAIEAPKGDYHIFQPDGNVYSSHMTPDDWIEAYGALLKKIMASSKLNDEQRTEKVAALAEANKPVTENFDTFQKVKIRAELAKAGVNQHPKPEASPSNQEPEPNEPTF